MALTADEIEESEISNISELPPKRRGRPVGSRNRRGTKAEVRSLCEALVGGINIALVYVSPEDILQPPEEELLVTALEAEANASQKILDWMSKAGKVTPHLLLIRALITISIPRLERHGYLPTLHSEEETNGPPF